ncbi:TetR/AcrR family transcriptional regulator [Paratractidigestivibacter sp.]|uniref:TetR/AcrR family transcriptional regulator n=1 Tax=Paratractidigestivibacter sp. TaxID=2847316 RepID=UPI002ABD19E1|nr:TetR/AcrR family transcriptional regulator [Paratractidigestivibacter sp.]
MAKQRSAAAQERLQQIVDAAVEIINEDGYSGLSLQAVADRVGITQPGVLHYVGSKKGLLNEVIEYYYDTHDGAVEYLKLFEPGQLFEGKQPKIPEYCRLLVEQNAGRRELVMLFQVLNTEAISPKSPAHEYFNKRSRNISNPEVDHHWAVPAGVDAQLTASCAMAAMYGLEGRWLARPDEIDYMAEWAKWEDVLFPLPLWEGYR